MDTLSFLVATVPVEELIVEEGEGREGERGNEKEELFLFTEGGIVNMLAAQDVVRESGEIQRV